MMDQFLIVEPPILKAKLCSHDHVGMHQGINFYSDVKFSQEWYS